MSIWDWLIVIVPVSLVMFAGFYARRYVRSVADFLSAGRVAGRYVISVGDAAAALSIIGLVSYVEIHYKTGFALVFWNNVMLPLGVVLSLFGYCTYRFRETKAMSLGQFLEMRYNRAFRIFASALRSLSEMLANMIMPAVAARFFIYFLDLPHAVNIFGVEVSMFVLIVFFCLMLAISLICCGGTLSLLITDAIQGIILFGLMAVFVVFILYKFNWSTDLVPVMCDRVQGESFLNPYDIENLRDFNMFMVLLTVVTTVLHRASWIGAGYTTSAKTPHEQKMAGLLGTWRGALNALFYVLVAIGIIAVMNHRDFAADSKEIKEELSRHIAVELVARDKQADFNARIAAIPMHTHRIGEDPALSQESNLDTPVLEAAHEAFKEYEGETQGNVKFQQYRTLYHQLMMASAMRNILPPVIMGLFCLLLVLAMISTDDTRIFSAALTLTQDVILPFFKTPPTPRQHIWLLRGVSIGIGVFFLCGSFFMSQLDYISLFVNLMCIMWLGGCGPVMIFGLYSRFGNTIGAFTSLITGMVMAFAGIFVQRNWGGLVYPWLVESGWVDEVGAFLETMSAPFNPFIVWEMNPVKCPINAYEYYFITMLVTLVLYCLVSWATQREPFNLDRMLHRGIYNTDGVKKASAPWTLRTLFSRLIGITPDYTLGDKCIAWSVFIYSLVYKFLLAFICVMIWNAFSPWPLEWWSHYFFITTLLIPGIAAFVSAFWFGIGGTVDLFRLFRDLEHQRVDNLDNGMVDGHVALSDKERFREAEEKAGSR